jgi:hypothetical protein
MPKAKKSTGKMVLELYGVFLNTMYSGAKDNKHRLILAAGAFIIVVLGVIIFIHPPAIFPDPSWGFQVMRSMQMGGGFNLLISPSQDNITNNTSEFLTWWSPGQYVVPYLFKLLLGVNTGKASVVTITVCNLLGLVGFFTLFKKLGFTKHIAALSVAFMLCQQFFVIPYVFYNGGETLLFAYLGWFLLGCFSFERIDWRCLLFILISGWVGFFCKSAFLWMYASGLCCLWIRLNLNHKEIKRWLISGIYLAIPAILSLLSIYKFFLSKGESPVTASQGLHFSLEAFAFPLASPFLSGFSVDDIVHGLLYHPDGPMFSVLVTTIILLLLAAGSIALILAIFRLVPQQNYRIAVVVFYSIAFLFFTLVFLRQLAISYEGRHFRIVGILVIPGTIAVFSQSKLYIKVIGAVLWLGITILSVQFLYSGLSRNSTGPYGASGISQQFIDQPSLTYLQHLDKQHPNNALFVFISADLGLEILHNRIITLEPVGPDIKFDYEDYIHHGHAEPLYILLPADYASNGKAEVIKKCFPDYEKFTVKELSEDYLLYTSQ